MPRLPFSVRPLATALLSVLVGAPLAGCPKVAGFEWAGQVAFAPAKGALVLQQDVGGRTPFTDKDYVTLGFSRIGLGSIAGLRPGETVVVGVQVTGVLSGGKVLKTILGPVTLDAAGTGELRHELTVGPFPLRGDVRVELIAQPLPAEEQPNVDGRLRGAGELLRNLHPYSETALNTARSLSTGILGAFRKATARVWKTSFVLRAAKPEVPSEVHLIPGEVVLVWQPKASAPAALRARLAPESLTKNLSTGMDALHWATSGEPFREAPFCTVMIQRSARLGWAEHPALRAINASRELAGDKKFDEAAKMLESVAHEVRWLDVLTSLEQALVLAFADLERARMVSAEGRYRKNAKTVREGQQAALTVVRRILAVHAGLLTVDERGNLRAEAKELMRAVTAP